MLKEVVQLQGTKVMASIPATDSYCSIPNPAPLDTTPGAMPVVISDDHTEWTPQQIDLKQRWDATRIMVARRNQIAKMLTFALQASISLVKILTAQNITAMQHQPARTVMAWIVQIQEQLQELTAFSMRAIVLVDSTHHYEQLEYASFLANSEEAITEALKKGFSRNHEFSFQSWSKAAEFIHDDISSQHTRSLTSRWAARENLQRLHREMKSLFHLEGDLDADECT